MTSPSSTRRDDAATAPAGGATAWVVAATAIVLAIAGAGLVARGVPAQQGQAEPEQTADPRADVPSVRNVSPGVAPTGSPAATPSGTSATWPVAFDRPSDTVLVFDDGDGGAVAVDLDTGRRAALELPGQRAGDQPFRLWPLGDSLVVGWGEIHAVPLAGGQGSRRLGDATIFLPAAEPDRLWLIDDGAGSTVGPSAWHLVDASGEVLHTVEAAGQPVRGAPGGLIVRRGSGALTIYDPDDGFADARVPRDARWVAAVSRAHVAWCPEDCRQLTVTDAGGTVVARIGGTDVERFEPDSSWLSPDGTRLAAVSWVRVGEGIDRELRIYLLSNGSPVTPPQRITLGHVHGAWTGDGRQFLFTVVTPDGGSALHTLGRWEVGGWIRTAEVTPHLRGLGTFVAYPREQLADLFEP